MKPIFFHLALCFLLLLGGCKSLLEKGNEQFLSGQYQVAIGTFNQILAKDSSNLRARQVLAESYRLSNRIEAAVPHYEALVAVEPTFASYFHLGQSHKANQQVEAAKKAFDQAALLTSDDRMLARVKQEIEGLILVPAIGEYFPNYQLVNYRELNSAGADYAPLLSEDNLYFTSGRASSSLYAATGTPYHQLFRARAEGLKVDAGGVQLLPEFRNEEGLNQAALAISPDGNTLIYARGNSTSSKDYPETTLFASYFRGAGFTQPIWMPLNEEDTWWNSTPAFSVDGTELYFASNRPGGYGGVDLYKATKLANGDFGNAVNLGPTVNTAGNELFPHPAKDGKFFFASDGHPGFGKLDLFVAEKNNDGKQVVSNLGKNFNSNQMILEFSLQTIQKRVLSLPIVKGAKGMMTSTFLRTKRLSQKWSMCCSMSTPRKLKRMVRSPFYLKPECYCMVGIRNPWAGM
jgi:tetratricopeptide (TPR) repeat protein